MEADFTPRERYEILSAIRERQYSVTRERNAAREAIASGNPDGYDEDFLKFLSRKIDDCESVIKKLGGV